MFHEAVQLDEGQKQPTFSWHADGSPSEFNMGVDALNKGVQILAVSKRRKNKKSQRNTQRRQQRIKASQKPVKQHPIIVRISTQFWSKPLQLHATCLAPANASPRDEISTDVERNTIERVAVNTFHYSWKITNGSCVFLLPETRIMCDYFQNGNELTLWNRTVHIEVVRQPTDRLMSLSERMTKWRAVARMLVIGAKVQPKIDLLISNLAGDTVSIETRPFTTIKDIRIRYCQQTGTPRTPQLKLFSESEEEEEALCLSALLKDYASVLREPSLSAAIVSAWAYHKRL